MTRLFNKTLHASEWHHHIPEGTGEERSCQIYFGDVRVGGATMVAQDDGSFTAWVTVEVRSARPVMANLISYTGELMPIGSGVAVSFRRKCVGYVGVEIVSTVPFAYQIAVSKRWFDPVDPVPMAIQVDEKVNPFVELARMELKKFLARKELDETFKDDVSVEELLDDLENGDTEFDSEPDMFGLGYEERMKEWEEARREAQARSDDEQGPEDAPVGADPSGPSTAAGDPPKA